MENRKERDILPQPIKENLPIWIKKHTNMRSQDLSVSLRDRVPSLWHGAHRASAQAEAAPEVLCKGAHASL